MAHTQEMLQFYRGCADRLDEIRTALLSEIRIDNKVAAFLTTAAREIREDVGGITEFGESASREGWLRRGSRSVHDRT